MSTDKKVLTVEEMMAADDIEYAEVEAFDGVVRIGSIDAGSMIEFVAPNNMNHLALFIVEGPV